MKKLLIVLISMSLLYKPVTNCLSKKHNNILYLTVGAGIGMTTGMIIAYKKNNDKPIKIKIIAMIKNGLYGILAGGVIGAASGILVNQLVPNLNLAFDSNPLTISTGECSICYNENCKVIAPPCLGDPHPDFICKECAINNFYWHNASMSSSRYDPNKTCPWCREAINVNLLHKFTEFNPDRRGWHKNFK